MKKRLTKLFCAMLVTGIAQQAYAQEDELITDDETDSAVVISSDASKQETENRNVMLNAESNTSPRNVNIGLPFKGDILILENDIPVVYWFWPTMPTLTWRYDNSLSEMGLLNFGETALLFGKVGYTVQSSDRKAGRKFKGYSTFYVNSFGSTRFDATVTGPINDNGWGYTASFYQLWDKGKGKDRMYVDLEEETTMLKFSIQKKYDRGIVRMLYKYGESRVVMSNYQPLLYNGDGETDTLDNFELGTDSYVVRDGLVPYHDVYTGESMQIDISSDEAMLSTTHNLYLMGDHELSGGWNLEYSTMYQTCKAPLNIQVPISVMLYEPDQQGTASYYYQGTDNPYTGDVQYVLNQFIPRSQSDVKTVISKVELTNNTFDKHNLRVGLTQVYNHTDFVTQAGMYVQTVEANPEMLDLYYGSYRMTDQYGGLPTMYSGYGDAVDFEDIKYAIYASDDIQVFDGFKFGIGGRLENQTRKIKRNIYKNEYIGDKPLIDHTADGILNKVATADFVYNITPSFGLLGDFTYNEFYDLETSWDYPYKDANGNPIGEPGTGDLPRQSVPDDDTQVSVMNYGLGVFYNYGTDLSIVSKITAISKKNIWSNSAVVTNPDGSGERADFSPIFYDIETIGWSTDVVWKPFKNFTLHYLLTLQDPQFKNYEYGAFGVNYSYSDNIIPELSRVIMELDPSYTMMNGKLRLWLSLRYYGKQYANPTNQYFYEAKIENFGGIEYSISRNTKLKLQITNFLDEKGVKGMMQGADQITDDRFVGRKIVAGSIRPRTIEFSIDCKF